VDFVGEGAQDAGGFSREYYHFLTAQLFSPDYGMFRIISGDKYWFSTVVVDGLCYDVLGTIVAMALSNRIVLPIRFPLLMYKKLMKRKLKRSDLAEIEPEIYHSILGLEKMRKDGQDIREAMLTFTTTVENFGVPKVISLVPGGEEIEVTNENLDAYTNMLFDWCCNEGVRLQFERFMEGFNRLFEAAHLTMFTADELDLLISGEISLSWEDLKRCARYRNGYSEHSPTIRLFWEVFDELNDEQKSKFLQFTTGTDRVPIGGLARMPITFAREGAISRLPISHTCSAVLCLPPYETKEELRKKLMLAINETEGFAFR
jgi:ubiquitin-protein ligase E3 A